MHVFAPLLQCVRLSDAFTYIAYNKNGNVSEISGEVAMAVPVNIAIFWGVDAT
jgi:hypothetical protein